MVHKIKKDLPIHPAEYLREAMSDFGLTVAELAKAIKFDEAVLAAVIAEKSAINSELALRLGQYFGTGPRIWTNLQTSYDLQVAINEKWDEILHDVQPHADLPEPVFAMMIEEERASSKPPKNAGATKRRA